MKQRVTSKHGKYIQHEVDVDQHGNAEHTENNVRAPLNVDECRRDEVAKSEVEGPVGRRGERDGLATNAEWVQLWWVDPGDWAPSWRKRSDKEVGACNYTFRSAAGDGSGSLGGVVYSTWDIGALTTEDTSVDEEPDGHECGTNEQSWATAPAVDPEKSRDSHDDVNNVLDRGADKQVVASETSHGEHVRDASKYVSIP